MLNRINEIKQINRKLGLQITLGFEQHSGGYLSTRPACGKL